MLAAAARNRERWCHAVEQHDVAHLLAGLGTISRVTVPPPEYPHDRTAAHLGVVPSLVTADRGSWDSTFESDLAAAGVTTVIIPRTGRPSARHVAIERDDQFVDAVKWRTGYERRVSHLNRDWAWRRTRPSPSPRTTSTANGTTPSRLTQTCRESSRAP